MKNQFVYLYRVFVFLLAFMFLLICCNKPFDAPPVNADPDIPVTLTIAALKASYAGVGIFHAIDQENTISGIVIADDRSGNFYKQIIIQDETGGIPILLDGNNVYTSYPIGRRLFIKIKGMMLGDYGGTIQLGLDSIRSADGRYLNVGRIPVARFDEFIIRGSYGHAVAPISIGPKDFNGKITDPLLSRLVRVDSVEFKEADFLKTYGDTSLLESALNFTLQNCQKQSVLLRNSSYAHFAALPVPHGNGALVAISAIFNGKVQLSIRDTSDIQFVKERCGTPVQDTIVKTIAEVLQYARGDSSIPEGIWMEGTVVSNFKNEAALNYRLQDGVSGIQIRFANKEVDPMGTKDSRLRVSVGGLRLSLFKNGLQITGITKSQSKGTATVVPRLVTIQQILSSARAWESTVVSVKRVRFVNNQQIQDATGTLETYLYPSAGIQLPTTAEWVTGYVSFFNEAIHLILRDQDDIQITPITEDFIALTGAGPLLLNFDNIEGGLPPGIKLFSSASPSQLGKEEPFTTTRTSWSASAGGFKNIASATGLAADASASEQAKSGNRALGLRPTGDFGDPGAAFVFKIQHTLGKSQLVLSFQLQQNDARAKGRSVNWRVDYGLGTSPRSFTPLTSTPPALSTTQGTFSQTQVSISLPPILNDQDQPVWIRVMASGKATGSGTRPLSALDDLQIQWK